MGSGSGHRRRRDRPSSAPWAIAALIALGSAACGASGAGDVYISGAGATFPYPIYSKWFDEYNRRHTGVQINYQSIGSGGGIRQLTNRTVFFGASDGPMSDRQLAAAPSAILHVPTVLGADVPVYNVPGIGEALRFTGPLLADIFLGRVTKWNDPAIVRLNPAARLPSTDITVVHRSDGSGTTYIWADYLAKVSPEWKQRVGVATALQWPTGVGGKGNEGVAGLVRQTPGAIGYVELIFALQTSMPFGVVENSRGEFVKASPASVTAAAAASLADIPDDFRVSITNADGQGAYPIASFTWLLLYRHHEDARRSRVMVEFMRWALTEGQAYAERLGYAPLPRALIERELAALDTIRVG